jgi:ATP/maltotriose-dependent transcriptional regulator MalT
LATAVVAMHEAGGGDLPVDRATSVIEQALATLERDGDPDRLARAYAALFFVQWASARLVDATSTAERAIEYARAAGSEGRARRVTSLLSGLFVEGPMPVPRGIAECGRMLDEVGESPGARYPVLESLGWLHAAADHPADARRCLSEALSIVEEVGQKVDTLYVRMALAETERIGGNLERAEKLATDVVHELAEPDSTTAVLAASLLSRIKAERGDSEAALSLLEALPADPQAALFVRADWLRARALALLQLRRVDDALRTASDALMVVESTDLIVARGEAQEILGKVELVRGNAAEARRHLEAARDLYRQKDYTVALRNVEAELRT